MKFIAAASFNNNMYGDFLAVGVITVVSAFIPLTKSDAVYSKACSYSGNSSYTDRKFN